MKLKTTMQELIEYLRSLGIILNEKTISEYKEKQKQQIIDAHREGFLDCKSGSQYYNDTYETEKID